MPTNSKIKVGDFNVENLFLRYMFGRYDKMKAVKSIDDRLTLEDDISYFVKKFGFSMDNFQLIRGPQRNNTAKVIIENQPDILAVQEVENLDALKNFNSKYLNRSYEYQMLVDGNDPRKIDVGVLSKFPITHARSYQFDKTEDGSPIFSRDCLEVDIQVANSKVVTLFINHFKSKIGGGQEKRMRQAKRVAALIRDRFGEALENTDFIIVGDLNAGPREEEIRPLLEITGVENVVQTRLPENEQWTHYYPPENKAEQLDYLILSHSLALKNPQILPVVERRGLGDYVKIYQGPRFPGVGVEGTEASDHCAVFMTLNI
jgi:endonuclease/exonuclease/phosphatase family metal-dependent hydrolase